ncbi:MAG: GWxTD domain-containing protein [Calditrichae bacterium]|nr:GWxTD domain-containing protein [Calditrichia bacterium]
MKYTKWISVNKSLTYIILSITLIISVLPAISNSKTSISDSHIPDSVVLTFWGSFALILGKVFIYDPYFASTEDESEPNLSENSSSYNAMIYILDADQLAAYHNLNSEQERVQFIEHFWNNLSEKYEQTELYNEFISRVAYSDSAFALPYRAGWQTDRGRINILHGNPDEISYLNFADSPYLNSGSNTTYVDMEIWYYDIAKGSNKIPVTLQQYDTGRKFFVFCKMQGNNDFDQIFSSEVGENIDPGLYAH